MVFKNFGQNLDHFGINRRPQDVKTMSSHDTGDVLKTNFWTSRNGHFAARDGHPKNTSEVGPEVKLHHGKLGPWVKSALWHIDV